MRFWCSPRAAISFEWTPRKSRPKAGMRQVCGSREWLRARPWWPSLPCSRANPERTHEQSRRRRRTPLIVRARDNAGDHQADREAAWVNRERERATGRGNGEFGQYPDSAATLTSRCTYHASPYRRCRRSRGRRCGRRDRRAEGGTGLERGVRLGRKRFGEEEWFQYQRRRDLRGIRDGGNRGGAPRR